MKMDQYIVVADSAFAKIFKTEGGHTGLSLVHSIDNPEGRKQNRELDADRPETRAPATVNYQGAGADTDSHGHDVELFAKEVCQLLQKHHHEGKFASLNIAAGPQLLGMLRKNLSDDCQKVLSKTVSKNLVRADEKDILANFE